MHVAYGYCTSVSSGLTPSFSNARRPLASRLLQLQNSYSTIIELILEAHEGEYPRDSVIRWINYYTALLHHALLRSASLLHFLHSVGPAYLARTRAALLERL